MLKTLENDRGLPNLTYTHNFDPNSHEDFPLRSSFSRFILVEAISLGAKVLHGSHAAQAAQGRTATRICVWLLQCLCDAVFLTCQTDSLWPSRRFWNTKTATMCWNCWWSSRVGQPMRTCSKSTQKRFWHLALNVWRMLPEPGQMCFQRKVPGRVCTRRAGSWENESREPAQLGDLELPIAGSGFRTTYALADSQMEAWMSRRDWKMFLNSRLGKLDKLQVMILFAPLLGAASRTLSKHC